jgi:hypothetical protein
MGSLLRQEVSGNAQSDAVILDCATAPATAVSSLATMLQLQVVGARRDYEGVHIVDWIGQGFMYDLLFLCSFSYF